MEYTRRFTEKYINEEDKKVKISIFIAKFFGNETEVFIDNKKFSLSQICDQDPSYIKKIGGSHKIHHKIWDCIKAAHKLC